MDVLSFEAMLSAAFRGGERVRRELRLSREEADYLRAAHPAARLAPLAGVPVRGQKTWFEVSFSWT
ncbi:MAG: hypothetical protein GX585_03060 [Clostridiales bacterium]|nr:hypothetical protein [Clostridiales bacterium]